MKTKAQLSTLVGRRLKVMDVLDSMPSEAAEFVENEYDSLLEKWRDQNVVYWPNTTRDTAEIPEAVFQPLADLLASHCASAFGKEEPGVSEPETGKTMPIGTRGWRALKRHARVPDMGFPTEAKYY